MPAKLAAKHKNPLLVNLIVYLDVYRCKSCGMWYNIYIILHVYALRSLLKFIHSGTEKIYHGRHALWDIFLYAQKTSARIPAYPQIAAHRRFFS
jgi:hypothetical protein